MPSETTFHKWWASLCTHKAICGYLLINQLKLFEICSPSAVLEPFLPVGKTALFKVATTYWVVVLIGGGYAGGRDWLLSFLLCSTSHRPQVRLVDRAEAENKIVVGEVNDLIC